MSGVVLLLVTVLPRPRRRDVVRLLLTGLVRRRSSTPTRWSSCSRGVPTLRITDADLDAFATHPGPGGLLPTVLTLHGYWRNWDGQVPQRARHARLGASRPPPRPSIVLGLVWLVRQGNRRGRWPIAFILVGAVLARGTQGPLGFLYQWAFDTVPLFATMREPAKWLGLIQLGYVIAVAGGVQAIQHWRRVGPS